MPAPAGLRTLPTCSRLTSVHETPGHDPLLPPIELRSPWHLSVPSVVIYWRHFNLSQCELVEFEFCGFVPFVKGAENVLGFTEGLKMAGQLTLSDERERPLYGTAIRLKTAYHVARALCR